MTRTRTVAAGLAITAVLGASVTAPAIASNSGETQAQADPAYKILKHLEYSGPGKASLRVGYYQLITDRGFGWNKVKKKHNITKYSAVEYR